MNVGERLESDENRILNLQKLNQELELMAIKADKKRDFKLAQKIRNRIKTNEEEIKYARESLKSVERELRQDYKNRVISDKRFHTTNRFIVAFAILFGLATYFTSGDTLIRNLYGLISLVLIIWRGIRMMDELRH